MPIIWPPDLPQKWLMKGSKSEPVDGRVQWEPEAGPPIVRSRFTSEHIIHSVELIVRDAQLNLLEAFYAASATGSPPGLAGGGVAFEWSDPDGQGAESPEREFKFRVRPSWAAELPGQTPHPDATGTPLDPAGFNIPDPTGTPQRTLRVRFSLIEAEFFVP